MLSGHDAKEPQPVFAEVGSGLFIPPPVRGRDGMALLCPVGELDLASEHVWRRAVAEVRDAGHDHVIADCSGITFCDSSGLNALLSTHMSVRETGGALVLARVPAPMRRVLEIAGTIPFLTLAATVYDAFDLLTSPVPPTL
ncbi:STAS domain-containing protein [Streptomyces sp. NPDC054796]